MIDWLFDWVVDHLVLTGVIIMTVVAIVALARPIDKVSDIRTIDGTVTDKRVKEDTYLVFISVESGEVIPLEVSDAFFMGRFNSSDLWGNIEINKAYTFEIGGSRWEFWSWYPNIYSITEKKIE